MKESHKRKDDIHYIDENEKFYFYSKIQNLINLIQEWIEKNFISESDDGIYENN